MTSHKSKLLSKTEILDFYCCRKNQFHSQKGKGLTGKSAFLAKDNHTRVGTKFLFHMVDIDNSARELTTNCI